MKQKQWLLLMLAALAIVAAIWSYELITASHNETLDQQVLTIASQLKCPICQGESVADSPSDLAQQMRGVIRQQLKAGRSQQEIIQYFEARYGEQIVWSPPWQGFTLLAWLVPIGLLLGGALLIFLVLRNWRATAPTSPEDIDAELTNLNDAELGRYRMQLEQELAATDAIFSRRRQEER